MNPVLKEFVEDIKKHGRSVMALDWAREWAQKLGLEIEESRDNMRIIGPKGVKDVRIDTPWNLGVLNQSNQPAVGGDSFAVAVAVALKGPMPEPEHPPPLGRGTAATWTVNRVVEFLEA
jgi:hypothetical protein